MTFIRKGPSDNHTAWELIECRSLEYKLDVNSDIWAQHGGTRKSAKSEEMPMLPCPCWGDQKERFPWVWVAWQLNLWDSAQGNPSQTFSSYSSEKIAGLSATSLLPNPTPCHCYKPVNPDLWGAVTWGCFVSYPLSLLQICESKPLGWQ